MFETKEQVLDFIRQEYLLSCARLNALRATGALVAGSTAEHEWSTLWLLCNDLGIDV